MWDFLDKMDKNLLYRYAETLSGVTRFFLATDSEIGEHYQREQKKRICLYLIWFVYRYVLQCERLEQTIPYQTEEILKKYKLFSMLINKNIFLCNEEILFYKLEDIAIILEILYGKYSLWEQFDCFIRNTKGVRRSRCMEAKKKYQELYQTICERQSGECDE